MRNKLTIAIIAIITIFTTTISCNKSQTSPTETTTPRTGVSFKTISGDVLTESDIHDLIVATHRTLHGYVLDSVITKDEMVTLCGELEPIIYNIFKDSLVFSTYTSFTIRGMEDLNMFDGNNVLKTDARTIEDISNIETDASLKSALANINAYPNSAGYISYAKDQITALPLSGAALIRANLFLNILEGSFNDGVIREPLETFQSDWYYYWRHKQVAQADAYGGQKGFVDGIAHGYDPTVAALNAAAVAAAYSIAKDRQLTKDGF